MFADQEMRMFVLDIFPQNFISERLYRMCIAGVALFVSLVVFSRFKTVGFYSFAFDSELDFVWI